MATQTKGDQVPLIESDRSVRVANADIVEHLRARIVAGEFAPGSRLPTRDDLEVALGASRVTIQKALDRLADENFIVAEGRRGTFVSQNPPHLTRYALVFPQSPHEEREWARSWAALALQATRLQTSGERNLPQYYGVNGHEDVEDYRRLVEDMRAHRVAGLIFASAIFRLKGTPLLTEPGIPRVGFMSGPGDSGIPSVFPDYAGMFRKVMAHFKARGRKRVAVFFPTRFNGEAEVLATIAESGIEIRPYWIQHIVTSEPEPARNMAHLLMNPGQTERPDAVFLADDNVVEHALAGLLDAGIRVGQDAEVAVHCNFPNVPASVLPVKRVGFDARATLAACMDSINRQRAGLPVEPITRIPALFEEEVPAGFPLAG